MFPDYFDWRWRAYINATLPSVLRAGSAVICVSEYSRQELLRFYKIPPERVHVVYNGIDHTCYNPAATLDFAWSQNLGLQRGYLLHVGALSHRKNIPTLLQAVAILRSRGKWTNRQLVLAGPRIPSLPGMAAIHDTILELDLSGSVLLTGRVPDQHMPALYVHASILVMPSLYEGFGFPALEAMACGTPVVASNMSSLPEITGDAALLVSPTDADALAAAIEGVMEHRSLAEELRRKGLERARQFSWQRTATETAAIYHIAAKS
jgi:glycosyltransferase involved in cell wall biosynthesis